MEDNSQEKIRRIRQQRSIAHGYFMKHSEVYRSFVKMEEATFRDTAISKKIKELIATGISVAINCESCMEWHINQAYNDGASTQEILEAVEVGIEMSGGPGTVAARFAMDVLESREANK